MLFVSGLQLCICEGWFPKEFDNAMYGLDDLINSSWLWVKPPSLDTYTTYIFKMGEKTNILDEEIHAMTWIWNIQDPWILFLNLLLSESCITGIIQAYAWKLWGADLLYYLQEFWIIVRKVNCCLRSSSHYQGLKPSGWLYVIHLMLHSHQREIRVG